MCSVGTAVTVWTARVRVGCSRFGFRPESNCVGATPAEPRHRSGRDARRNLTWPKTQNATTQPEPICPYAEPAVISSFCYRHALERWAPSRSSGRGTASLRVRDGARGPGTCSRTSGRDRRRGSAARRCTAAEVGALPSATAMLRSHRSWPMRRMAEPSRRRVEFLARPGEELDERGARRGRCAPRSPAPRPRARTCSTGRRAGSRRSRRCGCPWRRGTPRGSGPGSRW